MFFHQTCHEVTFQIKKSFTEIYNRNQRNFHSQAETCPVFLHASGKRTQSLRGLGHFFFLLLLLLLLRLIHQSVLLRLQRGKSPTVVLLIYFADKVALVGIFCVGGIKWERANVMKYSLSQEKIKIKILLKNTNQNINVYKVFK